MFGRHFELNEQTMHIVQEIGRHMPGGFFIYKSSGNEELLYANAAVLRIFGCGSLDEFKALTGFTFKGMLHPNDYEKTAQSINEQISSSDENFDYVEYRIIRKDGAVRWVDAYGHYTDTETYGGIYYVFISDITDKFIAEQAQRDQRDKMITALASDYRSVFHVDLDKDIAVCYRADPTDKEQPREGEPFRYFDCFK